MERKKVPMLSGDMTVDRIGLSGKEEDEGEGDVEGKMHCERR